MGLEDLRTIVDAVRGGGFRRWNEVLPPTADRPGPCNYGVPRASRAKSLLLCGWSGCQEKGTFGAPRNSED